MARIRATGRNAKRMVLACVRYYHSLQRNVCGGLLGKKQVLLVEDQRKFYSDEKECHVMVLEDLWK
jgi:hypothetical protein